jgi:formylmethanofuran:tetrahydromethanopterin formyltransferase
MGIVTLDAWGKVATITYPDAMDTLGPLAFGDSFGYEADILDDDGNSIPNPQSVEEFTIEKIFDYVGEVMRVYSLKDAQATAMAAAESAADAAMDSITVEIEDSP